MPGIPTLWWENLRKRIERKSPTAAAESSPGWGENTRRQKKKDNAEIFRFRNAKSMHDLSF